MLAASSFVSALPFIAAIITAIGGLVAAVYGARALTFKRDADQQAANRQIEVDRDHAEIEGVKVSVSSLQASNAELRIDNAQLRQDLVDLRAEMRRRDDLCKQQIIDLVESNKRQILELTAQIKALGGVPHE